MGMGEGDGGRHAGWSAWFDQNAAGLILFARQWTDTHADAEDVVQDVFVRFWRSGRQLDAASDPKAYLFASVKRAALDSRRGRLRRDRREAEAGRDRLADEPLFRSDAERDEWRVEVESALALLPGPQREVLVLKVWAGLTFPEVAAVVGVSPNTAASRYRYALEALRRRLAERALP